jgi:RNA polymerase-interacting CarD/CdnL/TRCF family regulator
MEPAESTNITQVANLAKELSAAKQDLQQTRQERDIYLKALYARLRAEAIAEQEEDERQMEHPITQPLLEEAIAQLRRQD